MNLNVKQRRDVRRVKRAGATAFGRDLAALSKALDEATIPSRPVWVSDGLAAVLERSGIRIERTTVDGRCGV